VRLQILVRQCNDVAILDLTGKATIDASEGELLSRRLRALTDNGKHKLLLNLANLTQVDSTGISAIVESYLSLQRQDGELKLLGPRGRVLEVLTLFRLIEVIPCFTDERQALASFRPQSYRLTGCDLGFTFSQPPVLLMARHTQNVDQDGPHNQIDQSQPSKRKWWSRKARSA
jgi:anti-anti-sigma factor